MGIIASTKTKFDDRHKPRGDATNRVAENSATVSAPIEHQLPTQAPAACTACHCPAFWQLRTDHFAENLRCLECEPPPLPSMVGARWMIYTPPHQLTGEPEPTWMRVDRHLRPVAPAVGETGQPNHLAEEWESWELPGGEWVHSRAAHLRGLPGQPGRIESFDSWWDRSGILGGAAFLPDVESVVRSS